MSLKNYDYYTYSHSVNVGVLSVGLGIASGMQKDAIFKLGLGAILHDIGKKAIHHDIVNKQGRLNDMEYQVIKTHVVEGEKILRENSEIPAESLAAMLHHHEKLTGRGYPFGLRGDNIELFGKITSIVDCYDALTTARPYRTALAPYQALSLITSETRDYDPELLKIFVTMLGNIRQ
jgi:HD-GYP domain-containing protein (c-di-GMP phosphodiesterase class II)